VKQAKDIRDTALEVEKVMYLGLANKNLREFPIEELYITSDNGKEMELQ